MIHQPLGNSQGGTIEAINYMCNERLNDGTARILKGNANLTKKIVKSIKFKQKLHVGVLSFEESNIDDDYKIIMMNSFENVLLPAMDGRYNILWVEHTDKGRLELNYLIPKIDLPTQRSLTPYFDKLDRYRLELWRDYQNIIYKLSDPNDPSKKQTLSNDKRIKLFEDYKSLDDQLHQLVSKNIIKNRTQLINLLNKNDIETNEYKSYISVKFKNSKKLIKLNEGIYSEEFRDIGTIRTICNRAREEISKYNNRDTCKLRKELREKIDRNTQRKKEYFRKRFIKYRPSHNENSRKDYEEYRNSIYIKNKKTSEVKLNTSSNDYISTDNNYVDSNSQSLLVNDKKGELNYDSYRTIIEGIRRERRLKQDSLQRLRVQRETVYKQSTECYEYIRKEHEGDKNRLPKSDSTFIPAVTKAYEECRNNIWEWEAILGAIEGVAKTIDQIRTRNEEYKLRIEHCKYDIEQITELRDEKEITSIYDLVVNDNKDDVEVVKDNSIASYLRNNVRF